MNRRRKPAGCELCSLFEENLPSLLGLDGEGKEPSTPEEQAIARHPSECPRCRETLESYRKTLELLKALPRRAAPADFLSWVKKRAT